MITQILASVAAAAAVAAAPPAAKPIYREIKDFVVACDNLRTCVVRWATEDFASEHSGFDAYFQISRNGGAAGAISVTLMSPDEHRLPRARSLMLDGRPVGRDLGWRGKEDLTLEGDQALAFVRALREGNLLTFSDGKGKRTVTLRGLKAALLAVDEAQGRLGTRGAFERTGAASDASVPEAPDPPVVTARPPDPSLTVPDDFAARVRKARMDLLEKEECEEERTELMTAQPLSSTEVLVGIGCVMGAYQGYSLVLRAPRDAPERARPLVLPHTVGDQPNVGFYTNDEWDPQSATFHEAAKGRGLGDCGSSTTWVFDGAEFQLAEAHRLHRCAGGPPGEWPTVYRSKVVVR